VIEIIARALAHALDRDPAIIVREVQGKGRRLVIVHGAQPGCSWRSADGRSSRSATTPDRENRVRIPSNAEHEVLTLLRGFARENSDFEIFLSAK